MSVGIVPVTSDGPGQLPGAGCGDGLPAGAHAELGKHRGDVAVDGTHRHHQPVGYLGVGQAAGQ
jgi:hypothetical protein